MNLLSKLIPLQRRCENNQLRCETRIRQHEKKILEIEQQISGIDTEIEASKQLIQTQKPKNSVLSRTGFFSFLRKQSILRRQIQQLDLQRTALLEQKIEVEKEREIARQERAFWLRKQDKYQHWAEQYKRKVRLERALREENDTQEITTWTL